MPPVSNPTRPGAHLVAGGETLTITLTLNGATVATSDVAATRTGPSNSTDTVAGFTIFS